MASESRGEDLERIAERLKHGDPDAFVEFAGYFGDRFYRYFRYTSKLSDADARDLSGTCITDIALKVSKYEPRQGGGFGAWVRCLMERAAATWWRKNRPSLELSAVSLEPDCSNPAELDDETTAAVKDAMGTLDTIDRAVVEARYRGYLPLEFDEIASDLSLANHESFSASRVRLIHHRALRKLEKRLRADPRMTKRIARSDENVETNKGDGFAMPADKERQYGK